ncbi:glycoside hydrolase family protein [Pontiella sulfatireligans]|uniref:Iota-carrageenase n=1 Tax=Pontiella sulfatireligans TaxID=2750658 RepID=A0A6C2UD72_9BACT|nr:hypothetical protein [Pontiella sulfatireligans]VGO18075.1 Iota-carrageenase [Pontiella sulfatireligans]
MKQTIMILALCTMAASVRADYKETMDSNGLTQNLQADYGFVDDNAGSDQSAKLQQAIDQVAEQGGGRLILPKGVYSFSGINLKSGVHLLIEKDTVIKPWWPDGSKIAVFAMDGSSGTEAGYVENVSIRGLGGKFIVDYSERGARKGEGSRVVNCRGVKNFQISDVYVKDSFTTYCAFVFTPVKDKATRGKGVYGPTDGLVKNLKNTDSSAGYGLVQMHGGDTIHFENLEAYGGGVTFRLETGSGGEHGGIHHITAKNIYCENGMSAMVMGPHSAQNGVVKVDGVTAKSCMYAAMMGPGYVETKYQGNDKFKPGIFGKGSTVENVHAIFGTDAAISLKEIVYVPKKYHKDLRIDKNDPKQKRIRGASIGAVRDATEGSWNPIIKNVTSEGFEYNKGVMKTSKKDRVNWKQVLKGLPIADELEQALKKVPKKKK